MHKFFRTFSLCFFLAVTLTVYAHAAEDILKVGLYYGNNALFSANLQNSPCYHFRCCVHFFRRCIRARSVVFIWNFNVGGTHPWVTPFYLDTHRGTGDLCDPTQASLD